MSHEQLSALQKIAAIAAGNPSGLLNYLYTTEFEGEGLLPKLAMAAALTDQQQQLTPEQQEQLVTIAQLAYTRGAENLAELQQSLDAQQQERPPPEAVKAATSTQLTIFEISPQDR